MHWELCLAGTLPYLLQYGQGRHRATGHIVGVLQADERGLRTVVDLRADGWLDVIPGEDAALRRYCSRETAGEGGHHRHLPIEHVRPRFADHLLAVLRVQANGDLVSHGAGGNKDRGRFAEDLGGIFFETVDGGVFAVDVVADLGRGHGLAHCWGWPGDGVAS